MGFWILVSCMTALIPFVMIIFGIIFLICAPKGVNYIFGYRTRKSMKSKETWDYSHKLLGRFWLILGVITLPLVLLSMYFVRGMGDDIVGLVGALVTLASFIPLLLPIIPVEVGLRKNFDAFGHKKENQ